MNTREAWPPTVWIDGEARSALSVWDRGLMYGDGVFRTLRTAGGRAIAWSRHYRKLAADCAAVGIDPPERPILERDLAELLRHHPEGVVKIVITRGEGGRGYALPPDAQPTRIVMAAPLPAYPPSFREAGVRLHPCALRLAHQPRLAGVKHLNRLENVLARSEWSDPDIPEGLLLDVEEQVIEGTMSNVFIRMGERLVTPDLGLCGVAGVQRERILEAAPRVGLEPVVTRISLAELLAADEVFVCNSVIGLWPVRALGTRCWGRPEAAPALSRVLDGVDD